MSLSDSARERGVDYNTMKARVSGPGRRAGPLVECLGCLRSKHACRRRRNIDLFLVPGKIYAVDCMPTG
jgi:hypothetical protein